MRTTIILEEETRDRLKKLKIAKRESYDEIINRTLDKQDEWYFEPPKQPKRKKISTRLAKELGKEIDEEVKKNV